MRNSNSVERVQIDLSVKEERLVARQFMGRLQWEMIVVGLGQVVVWLLNWYFVFSETYDLLIGFVVALLCACFAYLPSHEGQHGNISGKQKEWRWIDSFIGHISLVPIAASFDVLKVTHMKHHAYTNNTQRDVDVNSSGDHWWNAAHGVHLGYPKKILRLHAEEDPKFAEGIRKGVTIIKLYLVIRLTLVLLFPLETLLLWWLPSKISASYLAVFFSWFPHHPNAREGRYLDTKFWTIPFPRYFCQSMQTHVIHHMYPNIPHWDEPKAMEALRPFMIERGIIGAEKIPKQVRFNPLITR